MNNGFTFVEIAVVLAIIGVLAFLTIPTAINYLEIQTLDQTYFE